jgi:hypothetical protein
VIAGENLRSDTGPCKKQRRRALGRIYIICYGGEFEVHKGGHTEDLQGEEALDSLFVEYRGKRSWSCRVASGAGICAARVVLELSAESQALFWATE